MKMAVWWLQWRLVNVLEHRNLNIPPMECLSGQGAHVFIWRCWTQPSDWLTRKVSNFEKWRGFLYFMHYGGGRWEVRQGDIWLESPLLLRINQISLMVWVYFYLQISSLLREEKDNANGWFWGLRCFGSEWCAPKAPMVNYLTLTSQPCNESFMYLIRY